MPSPHPNGRFRVSTVHFLPDADQQRLDMILTARDGTTLTVECDRDAIRSMQQEVARLAEAHPKGLLDSVAGRLVTESRDSQAPAAPRLASDVTERIKAQRENVESRRIFEDLLENSDAAIIDYDFSALFRIIQDLQRGGVRSLQGYVAGSDERLNELVDLVRINNTNETALRMLGVASVNELVKQSKNIVDIIEAMFQGQTRIRGSEYLVAGGVPIPIVYSLRIPRTEEEARRVPMVILDLSDIKLAEAARQATVAKSQFLSSMSHEIRTPLNGVIGNLELLALTALDNEQFELIDDADKAAKALLGLVGNILDFSKIEAGKLSPELGDLSPAGLVEEAVAVLQSLARQKRIFVASTLGPDVPSLVRGDAMRIRQILLNLIGNAVKFTETGGVEVTVAVAGWKREMRDLRFEVTDSGRGFDQTRAAALFEPFTQDRSAVDGAEGTGLGLSICKSLVEAFGGTIGCEGVPGEGAAFWFTLPVAVIRGALPVTRPNLSGITALVLSRDWAAARLLEDYFKERGGAVIPQMIADGRPIVMEAIPAPAPPIDLAIIVAGSHDPGLRKTTRKLGTRHILPLLYGASDSPRQRLRQGFAAVIPDESSTEYMDRNIRLLIGHSQARDRLAAQQAAVVSAFSPGLRGKHVLVLEDRLVNQTVIQKQLQKLGIDCVLAANGIRGLEILARKRFDLILCDCSMPEMNGYDFTRAWRLREMAEAQPRVPIIALTANAFAEDADKCFEAGMDDFISKPVTMDRLAARLVRWLNPQEPMRIKDVSDSDVSRETAPIINIPGLAKILGVDDPLVLNEVLAEFLPAMRESLAQVAAAVAGGRSDELVSTVHGAKGEARSAAADGLAQLYAELELEISKAVPALTPTLMTRLSLEATRIEHFIQARLKGKAA